MTSDEFFKRLDQAIVSGLSTRQVSLLLQVGDSTVRRRKRELRHSGAVSQLQAVACGTHDANNDR